MRRYKPEKVHKVIFKISGEVLAGEKGFGINMQCVEELIDDLISIRKAGYSIGIVIGGGNFFRGVSEVGKHINRYTADNVGMLATIQNALIMSGLLQKKNYRTEIYSAIQVDKVAKFYTPNRATTSLNEGKICFFCGGIGNPFFTTDTAAILRAIELNADIVLKGTKVDGIYSADPVKDKNAKFIADITFSEVLDRELHVMDMTAFSLARENNMPIKVFNITKKGSLKEAILNKEVGTFVHK
ncbi:MAG: UMP kinase [Candidatus Cloacimonetes bacterium]|jgi:uridylate kinase|nr:UMP kinase [Candidatus Cloacimonadota bacterium]MBT4333536.1 UMP kinase [Candidatus Cloacimonadota bacterium]MBT4576451.1 UMP kinase [Candidatus Cloacimonadota bacterium]MBT5420976.1 UMP kinase [Candidatus Cloacimonadota bacterium]